MTATVGEECDPTKNLCLGGFICTQTPPEIAEDVELDQQRSTLPVTFCLELSCNINHSFPS